MILLHPPPPLPPLAVRRTGLQARVPDGGEVTDLLPRPPRPTTAIQPLHPLPSSPQEPPRHTTDRASPTIPPRLPHQAFQRVLLRPTLLHRHVWKISCPVPFAAVHEVYPQAVDADAPVERGGAGLEVGEQGQAAREGGEERVRDGAEACVFEGRGEAVGLQAGRERNCVEGANAAAEGFVAGSAGESVPGHEKGVRAREGGAGGVAGAMVAGGG